MKKLLFILLALQGIAHAQENPFKTYLSKNNATINIAEDNQWNLLKEDAEKNQFIILGENHGPNQAQLIDFSLLKYLNWNVGTKTYIAELDYAEANCFNEYLKTGNETYLKAVFRGFVQRHSQWGNYDFYNKIIRIRELNKTLPKDKRISFIGIDEIQNYELYLNLIKQFIENKRDAIFDSIRLMLNTKDSNLNIKAITNFAQNYFNKIQNNKPAFQKSLSSDFDIFEFLIRNLSYDENKMSREEIIFSNYKKLYDQLHLENEKLYGMWGNFHSILVPIYFVGEDFACKIANSNHPSAHKTISLIITPLDCKYNVWDEKSSTWLKENLSHDDSTLLKIDGITDVKELSQPNTITLFKLNNANSPFLKSGQLFNGIVPQGRLMGDFRKNDYAHQYFILMRNSDWLNPLPANF